MTDYAGTIIRMKAFDAAREFGHASMADLLLDARIAEQYMTGKEPAAETAPITDEIPFAGEGENLQQGGEAIVTLTADEQAEINKPAVVEPKSARTRRPNGSKKPKAKRTKPAREAAPATSQESGNQVPNGADHLPANDAADPNVPQAA